MSKDKKHMDKIIQEKLLQSEVRPPESSWDAIEASLDAASPGKSMLYYVRYVAAAAIVGLLITIGVFQLGGPKKQPDVITVVDQDTIDIKEIEKVQDSIIQKKEIDEKIVQPQKSGIIERKNIAIVAKPKAKETVVEQKSFFTVESILESLDGIYQTSAIALNTIIFDIPLKTKQKTAEELYQDYIARNNRLFAEDIMDQSDKYWSIGLGYGSAIASTDQRSSEMFAGVNDPDSNYDGSLFSVSNSNKPEESLNNFSFGLNINYQITKRLTLQSGLNYYKQGQSIKNLRALATNYDANYGLWSVNNSVKWSSSIKANTQNGNIVVENSTFLIDNSSNLGDSDIYGVSGVLYGFDLLQYFEYLEIPIIAGYTVLDQRFKFTLLAGLNTGILIGNKVFIDDAESVQVGTTEDMNTFVYKGVMGFSIDYPLFKQFHLFISPSLRYQLNRTNKKVSDIPNRTYFDFKTGLSYWF